MVATTVTRAIENAELVPTPGLEYRSCPRRSSPSGSGRALGPQLRQLRLLSVVEQVAKPDQHAQVPSLHLPLEVHRLIRLRQGLALVDLRGVQRLGQLLHGCLHLPLQLKHL